MYLWCWNSEESIAVTKFRYSVTVVGRLSPGLLLHLKTSSHTGTAEADTANQSLDTDGKVVVQSSK